MVRWLAPLLLFACTRSPGVVHGGPAAGSPADTLVVAVASDAVDLEHPLVPGSSTDHLVQQLVRMPLIEARHDCGLVFEPALATSWRWADDGLTLELKLRRDVLWSDGTPVTADDVVATWQDALARHPPLLGRDLLDGPPVRTGPDRLTFRFREPGADTARLSAIALTPPVRVGPEGVLASGPWRVSVWHPGHIVQLEPNPRYAGDEVPQLRRVLLRVVPERAARVEQLVEGHVDLVEAIQVSDIGRLQDEAPHVIVRERGLRSMDYVAWNLADARFSDLGTRQALALAVDVDGMMAELFTGPDGALHARRAVGTITPELCGIHADAIAPMPFDPERARALLAEAGWSDADEDGVLDRDGQPFAFELLTNLGNERRERVAERIRDDLAAVGVRVTVASLPFFAVIDRMRKRQYEAALGGWAAALHVEPGPVWRSDQAGPADGFNFTGYANPEVDRLIDAGARTRDATEAAPLWKELQAQIHRDQPYLFLWWMHDLVAVDSRFEGATSDLLSPLADLERWRVPPDRVKYAN